MKCLTQCPFPSPLAISALILGVIVINITIGLLQEGKAEKAAEAIKAMLSATANVVRDGQRFAVDADLLVPGDIVTIKSGDKIPADMRLLEVNNLQVGGRGHSSTTTFTGELPLCSKKQAR